MKIKLTTLIVIVVLAIAGAVGVMLLITNKDFGLMRTDKNNDGIVINEQENVSVVEEKINNEIEEKNQNNKIVKKLDDSKEIVYTSYYKESQEDAREKMKLPFINIDSEYAKSINEDIKGIQKNIEEGDTWCGYDYYLNLNILSVMVKWSFPSLDCYKIYNIDVYTGNKVKNSEILKYKNIDTDDFTNKLPEYYGKAYTFGENLDDALEEIASGEEQKNAYIDGYNKTIKNIPNDIEKIDMYLNEEGKIIIIPQIFPTAGDGYQWNEWNTNL